MNELLAECAYIIKMTARPEFSCRPPKFKKNKKIKTKSTHKS